MASLSHRFKSSPAIPRNLAISGIAGYMMNAGHFRRNLVSSGDLNRGSQGLPRVLFGYFLHDAKSDNPFPCRELRGSANLDSARRNGGFARTKLKPSQKKIRGSANLESAQTRSNFTQAQLNPLPLCGLFSGGHAAFLDCLRQPTAALRRLLSYFL